MDKKHLMMHIPRNYLFALGRNIFLSFLCVSKLTLLTYSDRLSSCYHMSPRIIDLLTPHSGLVLTFVLHVQGGRYSMLLSMAYLCINTENWLDMSARGRRNITSSYLSKEIFLYELKFHLRLSIDFWVTGTLSIDVGKVNHKIINWRRQRIKS